VQECKWHLQDCLNLMRLSVAPVFLEDISKVAPDLIISNLAEAEFGRIFKSGQGPGLDFKNTNINMNTSHCDNPNAACYT